MTDILTAPLPITKEAKEQKQQDKETTEEEQKEQIEDDSPIIEAVDLKSSRQIEE